MAVFMPLHWFVNSGRIDAFVKDYDELHPDPANPNDPLAETSPGACAPERTCTHVRANADAQGVGPQPPLRIEGGTSPLTRLVTGTTPPDPPGDPIPPGDPDPPCSTIVQDAADWITNTAA